MFLCVFLADVIIRLDVMQGIQPAASGECVRKLCHLSILDNSEMAPCSPLMTEIEGGKGGRGVMREAG